MKRSLSAWFLLAVLLSMALPRTLFHHCLEGQLHLDSHGPTPALHADFHCAICEAPVPVLDLPPAPASLPEILATVDLAVPFTAQVHTLAREAPKLRGPPVA